MSIGSLRGRRRHLFLLLFAGVVAPFVLFAVNLYQGRHHAMASAEDRLSRRAAMLAEHAARVLDSYALVFDLLDRELAHLNDDQIRDRADMISVQLAEHVVRAGIASSILVFDGNGVLMASSNGRRRIGSDNSDRSYYQMARSSSRGQLVVGEQIIGRVTNRRMFSLARRGNGGQIYAALIAPGYFERQFSTLAGQDGSDLVVTLYREDGKQLVRYPPRDQPVNLAPGSSGLMAYAPNAVSGTYRIFPMTGHREKLYAFHRVPGYPVYVTYGVAVADLLADWRASAVTNGLLALASALLLGSFSLVAMRRADQSARTERLLEGQVEARASEVVAAMAEREVALRAAEQATAAKAHFLAAASHDLRQPIQGLRLFLEVLDGRLTDPDNRRVLLLSRKALEGAEDLLSTLLDVSTLEAGMIEPTVRQVPMGPIIDQLTEEFRRQAEMRLLSLRAVPSTALVHTDPVLLARLLRNLLTNAVRYTERGGVLLGCRRSGAHIRVEVWDTGAGIPDDKLDSVFEDFVQLGNPERDRAKGLGLGLSVVRRMAGLMGHPIGVRSVVGRGTVFWVLLPLALDTSAASGSSPN